MNVRITPRGAPQRTDLYAGVAEVYSDGQWLHLWNRVPFSSLLAKSSHVGLLRLTDVAEIALDEDPGDLF